jgi:hypothetical protein
MSSRTNYLRSAVGCWEPFRVAVGVLVLAGLLASGLANIWIEAPRDGALPGVALGSQALLVAERGVAFFAIWLLVLVVVAQAFRGRLPIEVSGRGVRYADAPATENMARTTDRTIARLEAELAGYRQEQNDLRRLLTEAIGRGRI